MQRIEILALNVRRSGWLSGPVDVFYQLSSRLPPEFHTHMLCLIPASARSPRSHSTKSVTLEHISAPNILTCIPLRYLMQRCRKADIIVTIGNAAPILLMSAVYARLFHKIHIMLPMGVYHPLFLAERGTICNWANWLLKQIVARKAYLWAKSEIEVEDLKRAGFSNRILNIPNFYDFSRMEEIAKKARNLANDSNRCPRTVTYIGRLHPKKGTVLLLNAWRIVRTQFQSAHLRIVGFDSEDNCALLQRTANELGISHTVDFVGQLPKDDVFREMAEADIVVFPTLGDSFGSVVVEALGCGTPVIVTPNCPWKRLERVGCGIVAGANPNELAGAMIHALGCKREKLVTMGRLGQEYVKKNFCLDIGSSRVADLYQELLKNPTELHC